MTTQVEHLGSGVEDGLVMVVDDDRDIREALSEVLEDEGYHVVTAEHGLAALERLRSGSPRPCLILLDLMMPTMDGRQFRSEQRQSPELAAIPTVVLSAFTHVEKEPIAQDAAGVLKKPVQLATLLATVNRLCGREPA